MSDETPAGRNRIFRSPVAPELEEVVYPVDVGLRPEKYVRCHVEAHTRREMYLEVVRALEILVCRTAARILIAIGSGIVELQIRTAEARFELGLDTSETGRPDSIEIVKDRVVIQACVTSLAKAEIGFTADTKAVTEQNVRASFPERTSECRRRVRANTRNGIRDQSVA